MISVERALILEITSAIHIEDPTGSGTPTFRELLLRLMAQTGKCTSAPAAFVMVRSKELNDA